MASYPTKLGNIVQDRASVLMGWWFARASRRPGKGTKYGPERGLELIQLDQRDLCNTPFQAERDFSRLWVGRISSSYVVGLFVLTTPQIANHASTMILPSMMRSYTGRQHNKEGATGSGSFVDQLFDIKRQRFSADAPPEWCVDCQWQMMHRFKR